MRIFLTPESLGFAEVEVAEGVQRLVMVLGYLGHHEVYGPVVRRVRSCNQFAGRWLVWDRRAHFVPEEKRSTQLTLIAAERHIACRNLASPLVCSSIEGPVAAILAAYSKGHRSVAGERSEEELYRIPVQGGRNRARSPQIHTQHCSS